MALASAAICIVVLFAAVLMKRARDRREFEQHTITPEALHALLASNRDVLVVDVRQPFDLLGDSVIIPGSKGLHPRDVQENPSLFRKTETLSFIARARAIRLAGCLASSSGLWVLPNDIS